LLRLDDTRHQLEIGDRTASANANMNADTNVNAGSGTQDSGASAEASPRSALAQQVDSAYRDLAIFKQSGSFRFLESILDPGRPTPVGC
jgi:hypothetical protein